MKKAITLLFFISLLFISSFPSFVGAKTKTTKIKYTEFEKPITL